MKKSFFVLVLILLSCGIKREVIRLRDEIDEIHYYTSKIDSLQKKQFQVLLETRAEILQRLEYVETRILALENRIKDLEQRFEKVSKKSPSPSYSSQQPLSETPSSEITPISEELLYTQAIKDYIMGQYNLSIQGFTEFLNRFPRSDLSDNARYWIGECYLALGQRESAKKEFERVVRDYLEGNKRATALYKLGIIAQSEGKLSESKKYFQSVINEYPGSEEAEKAKEKIEEMK